MTPLEHALQYAARGWRVAPIPPGQKHPAGLSRWQELATTDPATITSWWTADPDHGVCIATGPASGVVAIDIDTYAGGDDGWAELLARHHADEPETVEAITGGGGRHLLFAHPDDDGPIITNAAHALPPGIDVRGDGGQIVVAPTIHPRTGVPYCWEAEHDPFDGVALAPLPGWLLELLRAPVPSQVARAERTPYVGGDSIVERFAAEHTWPELLTPAGWTFHSARSDQIGGAYELWTRPGKTVHDGISASLYYGGSDVLKVFTSSAAPLQSGETYTRFGFYAAMEHGGDMIAAGRAARRESNTINVGASTGTPAQKAANMAPPTDPPADTPAPPTRPAKRPDIVHNGRQLDGLAAEALDALMAANEPPTLFVRAGQLARLRQDEETRPIIEALRTEHMRLALAEAADWWRSLKDGGLTATSPPNEVAVSVLAAGEWEMPPLAGVVELPVLRPDGTFATEHGYDAGTKLYHWHRGEPYQPVPETPTADELAAAVALVDDVLCDFPWDTSADRANAWGLLLTPLVRAIVGQVPMALVDAPEPGTGKGLLVSVAALITIGRSAALMAWPTDDTELEKKVTAALMAGNTMIIWDNVEGMIKSATLAAVLTADSWQGRVLGRSEMVMVPNRATWCATGNNIDVGGDLARRCYRIRLDARQAQPWKRTGFRHADLAGYVTEHRGDLLHALCTIVRSWWVAGRPMANSIGAMGGYSSWVRTVGGILEHAGVGDFLGNLAEFHASADRDAQAWEAFLTAWSEYHGEASMTVAELVSTMKEPYMGYRLRDVLPDDLSGHFDSAGFGKRLGRALRQRTGRHYGDEGLHLVEMPRDRRQVAIYSVTTRSVALFEGAGLEEKPARDDSLTRSDANAAGFAGFFPNLRGQESYPQDENHRAHGPEKTRETRKPAFVDPADLEMF